MIKSHQYGPKISAMQAGQICPYCNGKTEYVDSIEVYEKSYGMIYFCRPCKAWVGVHKGTDRALGRLADAELREWKMLAHYWFDPIANSDLIHIIYPIYICGVSGREKAYWWLAQQLGIQREHCHIGMFDVDECKQVVAICQPICAAHHVSPNPRLI